MSINSSLSINLQTLQKLQTKLVKDIADRQSLIDFKQQKMNSQNDAVFQNIKHLKQCYSRFAEECKVQWIGIYNQLLQLFNKIVEVYQIRIQKLEDDLEDKNEKIKELQQMNSRTKCSDSGVTDLHRLHQTEEWNFNGKRVKINDFISDSWVKSQPRSSQDVQSQQFDAITEVDELQTDDRSGKTLMDMTDELNKRKSNIYKKLSYKQSEELWEGEVSAILSAESTCKLGLAQDFIKGRRNSATLSSNTTINLRNSIKNAKNTEDWEVQKGSNTRLERLRQSLINKRKFQRRII